MIWAIVPRTGDRQRSGTACSAVCWRSKDSISFALRFLYSTTCNVGIAKIFLRYKIDTVENAAEKFIALDLSKENPDELRNVRRRHEFDLGALRPTVMEGANIEYWVEVQDGNNVTGPGVASSDRFRVRIVSEIEKRADLMNRLNDQLGAIDFVAEDQEKLSQALGAMIHGKSSVGNPATKPVTTLPGLFAPGRPPSVGDHAS